MLLATVCLPRVLGLTKTKLNYFTKLQVTEKTKIEVSFHNVWQTIDVIPRVVNHGLGHAEASAGANNLNERETGLFGNSRWANYLFPPPSRVSPVGELPAKKSRIKVIDFIQTLENPLALQNLGKPAVIFWFSAFEIWKLSQYTREAYGHKERKGHPRIAWKLEETVLKL